MRTSTYTQEERLLGNFGQGLPSGPRQNYSTKLLISAVGGPVVWCSLAVPWLSRWIAEVRIHAKMIVSRGSSDLRGKGGVRLCLGVQESLFGRHNGAKNHTLESVPHWSRLGEGTPRSWNGMLQRTQQWLVSIADQKNKPQAGCAKSE